MEFYQQGAWDEAEKRCRLILEQQPDHLDALNLLAGIHYERQEYEQVLALTYRALAIHEDALLHGNLGLILYKMGDKQQAEFAYRRAIAMDPAYLNASLNLAVVLREQGDFKQAIQTCKNALQTHPRDIPLLHQLAHTLFLAGLYEESLSYYQRLNQIDPSLLDVHVSLGIILSKLGRNEESVSRFRKILENRPDHLEARYNLAIVLRHMGQWDETMACCQEGLTIHPNNPTLLAQLGFLHLDLGMVAEGVSLVKRSAQMTPESQQPPVRHIGALLYDPEPGEEERFQIRTSHAARFDRPTTPLPPFRKDRSPDRVLRVGYLSADFRFHPVGRNLLPVLESHDRRQVALFCYSNLALPDEMTLTVMSRLAAPPMMKDNGGWVATARSRKEMVAPTLTANEIRRFASYPGLLP